MSNISYMKVVKYAPYKECLTSDLNVTLTVTVVYLNLMYSGV